MLVLKRFSVLTHIRNDFANSIIEIEGIANQLGYRHGHESYFQAFDEPLNFNKFPLFDISIQKLSEAEILFSSVKSDPFLENSTLFTCSFNNQHFPFFERFLNDDASVEPSEMIANRIKSFHLNQYDIPTFKVESLPLRILPFRFSIINEVSASLVFLKGVCFALDFIINETKVMERLIDKLLASSKSNLAAPLTSEEMFSLRSYSSFLASYNSDADDCLARICASDSLKIQLDTFNQKCQSHRRVSSDYFSASNAIQYQSIEIH